MSQILFEIAPLIATGAGPSAIAIADFNGDNQLDIVTANRSAASISLSLGDGTGKTFAAATTFAVGAGPMAIVAGDWNGDGLMDLATANFGTAAVAGTVSIGLNDGAGNFTFQTLNAGTNPSAIAVGNFNADENLDLAIANSGSNNVTIAFGNADGSFGLGPNLAVGAGPVAIAVGDLNDDGTDDLAIANARSNNVTTFVGDGQGGLTLGTTVAVGTQPSAIGLGDFNDDNQLDIVTSHQTANTIAIAFNNGAGGFAVGTTVAVGNQPTALTVEDFNNDGKLDIATANLGSNNLSIALGNNRGGLTVGTSLTVTSPGAIATADLNGDERFDIVAASVTPNQATVLLSAPERTEIYWRSNVDQTGVIWNQDKPNQLVDARYLTYGQGIGDARVGTNVRYDPAIWRLVDTVDMNGDGVRDIIYTRDATTTTSGEIRVLTIGQFNGQTSTVEADREYTFGSAFGALNGQVAKPGLGWVLVGVADMNGDGQGDLVFYNRPDDRTVIWTTDESNVLARGLSVTSDGAFSVANGYQPTGDRNAWNIQALGDFTGDGQTDILWRRDTQEVVLWELDGTMIKSGPTGKSAQLQNFGLNFKVSGVGDFNNDGRKDVLWRDQTGNVSRIWTFGADGKPTDVTLLAASDNRWQIDGVADMNQDGTSDVIWRNNNTNTLVIFGIKDAAFTPVGSGEVLNFFPGGNRLAISPGRDYQIDKVAGLDLVT